MKKEAGSLSGPQNEPFSGEKRAYIIYCGRKKMYCSISARKGLDDESVETRIPPGLHSRCLVSV